MIHISYTLQVELGINEQDQATLSITSIFERTGYYSGLSMNIRNNIRSPCSEFIDIVRVHKYPGWFQVVQEY